MKNGIIFLVASIFTCGIVNAQTLHLFGGQSHDVYLGCLNCSSYDSDSIWNQYGAYGNHYNSDSIWNQYGTYGNRFGSYSPWNSSGLYPPVIVDKDGDFYGYLTTNKFKSKRATFDLALILYDYYDTIRDDVSKWYDIIFR